MTIQTYASVASDRIPKRLMKLCNHAETTNFADLNFILSKFTAQSYYKGRWALVLYGEILRPITCEWKRVKGKDINK